MGCIQGGECSCWGRMAFPSSATAPPHPQRIPHRRRAAAAAGWSVPQPPTLTAPSATMPRCLGTPAKSSTLWSPCQQKSSRCVHTSSQLQLREAADGRVWRTVDMKTCVNCLPAETGRDCEPYSWTWSRHTPAGCGVRHRLPHPTPASKGRVRHHSSRPVSCHAGAADRPLPSPQRVRERPRCASCLAGSDSPTIQD
jgi:hypothetical protein